MKKLLILFFLWLGYHSSFAQATSATSQIDSPPITKSGITLPQLITTDIKRSNLHFGLNLSQGLKQPHLSANYQKFISDKKKQFSINARVGLNHSLSFQKNDNQDFYNFFSLSLNLGANLKAFNQKNYFIEVGTQNQIAQNGGFSESNYFSNYNSITLGIGKGRIDFVNDGAAAVSITDKLSRYCVLKRELSENEYSILTEKIRSLKNRRKFVNRSYPLTEAEEIQELLSTFGVTDNSIDITSMIHDAYRFEPMLDRTTGSQFRIAATASYSHIRLLSGFSNKGLSSTISYMIHSPISTKWQYNKGITGYITASESSTDDPTSTESRLKRAGISIKNDFHYLVDARSRLSFISNVGYDFKDELYYFEPIGIPYTNNNGFYISTRTEFEYQISRTMSTTLGINLDITPDYTFTGLSLGLKF